MSVVESPETTAPVVAGRWSLLAQSADTARRIAYPMVLPLGGKLWVVGGGVADNVLSSADAKTWRVEIMSARREVEMSAGAVYRDALFVCGGWALGPPPHPMSDVWTSGDGKTWTQVTGQAAWLGRREHCLVNFSDRLWVLGGSNGLSGLSDDVWSAGTGQNWTQVSGSGGYTARCGAAAVAFLDRLWLLGGRTATGYVADALSTSDGVTWQTHATPGWAARKDLQAHVIGDTLYVFGGAKLAVEAAFHDIWSTRDGETWTLLDDSAPWGELKQYGSAVLNGSLIVLAGNTNGAPNANIYSFTP